jgi:hypothetical protein
MQVFRQTSQCAGTAAKGQQLVAKVPRGALITDAQARKRRWADFSWNDTSTQPIRRLLIHGQNVQGLALPTAVLDRMPGECKVGLPRHMIACVSRRGSDRNQEAGCWPANRSRAKVKHMMAR